MARYEYRVVDAHGLRYGPWASESECRRIRDHHAKFGPSPPYRVERREVTAWKAHALNQEDSHER